MSFVSKSLRQTPQSYPQQLSLLQETARSEPSDISSTFSDNLALPIHRWFRYSAGFSALWVRTLIKEQIAHGRRTVLDPFAGSGTVLLESEYTQTPAIGIESHPFVARIARTKLFWRESPTTFVKYAN